MSFLAAVVQLTSTEDVGASIQTAEALIAEAAARGASLIALPENASFMGSEHRKLELSEPIDGPTFATFSRAARTHGVHLLAGTLPERGPDPAHTYNTSVLFGPDGAMLARYRKIHLFDVEIGEGAMHRESSSVAPGSSAVVSRSRLGRIGLTVCYDLRFPGLYRALGRAGAEILTVPAAFTVPTGRDHWEVLLRARAIENLAYVVAPAQIGAHNDKRRTYGRSMIIDPWGTVLATCPDRPSVALAEINLEHLRDLRRRLPCAHHERPELYEAPVGDGLSDEPSVVSS